MSTQLCGRFAPSPSGRMHLGNVFCALLAWLSVRSRGGRMLLRVEDIDTARCSPAYIPPLIEDLHWLGLDFDDGDQPETYQSHRTAVYQQYFEILRSQGLVYPCYCTRAERHAASAPHAGEHSTANDCRCRRYLAGDPPPAGRSPAWRLILPDREIAVADGLQGHYCTELVRNSSGIILRRSDGVFAYQLAVVVDDALSGVTEVVRGRDLLSVTPEQVYLYELFGFTPPVYYHIPLLLRGDGVRLSKRDGALDMGALRERFADPAPLIGMLAYNAGLLPQYRPITASELLPLFDWERIPQTDILTNPCGLF